jgi:MYXO-CTERM domain-containing protein
MLAVKPIEARSAHTYAAAARQSAAWAGWALAWTALAIAMMVLASLALSASPEMVPALPASVRGIVNRLSGPMIYTLGTFALLGVAGLAARRRRR